MSNDIIRTREQALAAGLPADGDGLSFPPEVLFSEKLGICGCCDYEAMAGVLLCYLEWAGGDSKKWETDGYHCGMEDGIYFWIATIADVLGYIEHGGTISYPWLTPEGYDAIPKLRAYIEEIEAKWNSQTEQS